MVAAGVDVDMRGFVERLVRELAERCPGGASLAIILGLLDDEGLLTTELARAFVARAFDSCSHPSEVLGREQWVGMFKLAGFTREWSSAKRPTESRRLFRGSGPAGIYGLCWSSEIGVARYFASRQQGGVVVVALVSPERQLAELAVGWEEQVVVDTTGLAVEVLEDAVELGRFSLDELRGWMDDRRRFR